jgi:hypothetical protein
MDGCETIHQEDFREIPGYLLLVFLYFEWFVFHAVPLMLEVGSMLAVTYFSFQAPVPCCAENRDRTFCRNNARGIIGGCHLKQHKWQNLRMLVHRHSWTRLAHGLFRKASGNAAALGALGSLGSVFVAAVALVVT